MKRKFRCLSVLLVISLLLNGCNRFNKKDTLSEEDKVSKLRVAKTTPFGRYPEKITYTLGKMTGANNSNMPDGDDYENNAYTRYLNKVLNVQNKDTFEASNEEYDSFVSMAIATGNMPDIMVVRNREDLEKLVEKDLVEDLSAVYQKCASITIKKIYNSYDKCLMDSVTFNGKIMALPETNIEDGPNLLWLRKDWLDKLNLPEPKTLDDVENIVKKFITMDPGGNGPNKTIGLLCDTNLTGGCGYSSEYLMDLVFANYNAYPKQWIEDKNGKIVYGSIQPEVKSALKKMQQFYKEGVIDKNFLLRTCNNLKELIINGKSGSFFGPWWSPNNPLVDAVRKNTAADWKPYLISTKKDGTTSYFSQNPNYKYVVVRKGYQHPEIAVKILSVLFDYARYQDRDTKQIAKYYQLNVDPTARPLAINVDYNDALHRCYNNLQMVFNKIKKKEELEVLEQSYYDSCLEYKNSKKAASAEDWAAYTSRITACEVINENMLKKVPSLYFGKTDTMIKDWWKLEQLEKKSFLEIVSGEKDISYFDRFVEKWKKENGEKITEEVRQKIEKQNKAIEQ